MATGLGVSHLLRWIALLSGAVFLASTCVAGGLAPGAWLAAKRHRGQAPLKPHHLPNLIPSWFKAWCRSTSCETIRRSSRPPSASRSKQLKHVKTPIEVASLSLSAFFQCVSDTFSYSHCRQDHFKKFAWKQIHKTSAGKKRPKPPSI